MKYKINSSADIKWIHYESLNDTMNTIRSNPNRTQAVCLVLCLLCYYLDVVPLDVDLPYVLCSRVSDYYNNMYNYYCVVMCVYTYYIHQPSNQTCRISNHHNMSFVLSFSLSYNLHWCALIHVYKCALLCCVCTCRCDCVQMWLHVCKIVHT